ncbi:hypothetical protein PMAYCL1PPCAC_09530 [Pristionchus mayeri]|uniref:Protein kinase domain-containing protein n=1 Tax=Pristionchus mayeri TaxID=1317129 RepID=A0AAN5CCC0_9BILA|nr:hypothetical protein PMAYCL1PPCAC_09530 [Pristionchus mayeri]
MLWIFASASASLRLRANADRPLTRMLSWFRQIVSAVAYMHSKGFIHRDLKPSNILFADIDHLKICDLGLATEIAMQDGREISMTRTSIGTKLYWAPEQTCYKYTSKVDIFSLGLILIEIIVYMDDVQRKVAFKNYSNGMPEPLLEHQHLLSDLLKRLSTPDEPKNRPNCETILEELQEYGNLRFFGEDSAPYSASEYGSWSQLSNDGANSESSGL